MDMEKRRRQPKPKTSITEVALRLYALQNPEIEEYLQQVRRRYGKYAVPAQEVRAMMDKALGSHTLSQELHKLRGD
ncbi:MAG: hypothetical protein M1358_14135 [Chloroflexi bacterium]|nr:hypothetical protein [Chloroflexota bacterium]